MVAVAAAAAAEPVAPTPATELKLTSPKEWQVFQRTDSSHGVIVVEGEWSVARHSTALPDALEASVQPSDATAAGTQSEQNGFIPLPFDIRAHGFRAELPTKPGGWYDVQIRLKRHGSIVATADFRHVGVGEVFVIAGQSNSANYAEEKQQPQTGLVTAFDGDHWAPANDPQPGATGTKGSFIPSFGDALVRRFKVPVGVVCVGVGSTSVREWLPAGHPMSAPPTTGAHCMVIAGGKFISSGELWEKLACRLRSFPPSSVRAVLWHQGESDWMQPDGHNLPLSEFRADLAELVADSRAAAGWNVPWFVAQVSYGGPTQTGSDEMRAQQRAVTDGKLTLLGPNTDTLTGLLREKNGQGVHFSAEGQRRHGELWAEVVGAWIDRLP